MRRAVAVLALAASLNSAGPGLADICGHPCSGCATSALPSGLQLVGATNGEPDARGEAVVIVRDVGHQPVPSCTVTLRFSPCYGDPQQDLWIATSQPFPGQFVTCDGTGTTISAVTNDKGRAVFRILGSARPGPEGITTHCVTILADNEVLGMLRLGAYDLDGAGGVNASDLSLFLRVLFASPTGYRTRADYNGDGLCNSADLSRMAQVMLGAGSLESSPRCLD